MKRRAAKTLGGVLAIGALAAAPAAAQGPTDPYNGRAPFNCQLQDVGTGVAYPDPGAEPFCVEFDKTQQNVSDFGIFDFLSKEPARTAAASPKCFYFQRDHWTGSFVQGQNPSFYHWDGSYYFDKSNGGGGANLANFTIGGEPADGTPYAPPQFQPYMTPGGGGGAYVAGEVEPDPSCAVLVDTPAERVQVYYRTMPAAKVFRKRVGPVRLRARSGPLHQREGPAHAIVNGTERFDATGGGYVGVVYRGSRDPTRVAAILTTSPTSTHRGVGPGARGRKARRRLDASFASPLGRYRLFEAPRRKRSRMVLGIEKGKLLWIAVANPRLIRSDRALRRVLRRLAFGGSGRLDSTGMPW